MSRHPTSWHAAGRLLLHERLATSSSGDIVSVALHSLTAGGGWATVKPPGRAAQPLTLGRWTSAVCDEADVRLYTLAI